MTITSPAQNRPEVIQSLIDGVDRYNPDNVTILEDYLVQQLQNEQYDCLANLAILKLYQFNPHIVSDQVTNNILVKALAAVPGPDFNLCLYLLSESQMTEAPIQKLIELQHLLEECKFVHFWKSFEGEDGALVQDLTRESVGFQDAIRRNVIAGTIRIAFQVIKADLAKKLLNIPDDAAFKEFASSQGWKFDGAAQIQIPVNKDNEAKATVLRENLKFEQMSKIISFANSV